MEDSDPLRARTEHMRLEQLRADMRDRKAVFEPHRFAESVASPEAAEQFSQLVQAVVGSVTGNDRRPRLVRWLSQPHGTGIMLQNNHDRSQLSLFSELSQAEIAANGVHEERRRLAKYLPRFVGSYLITESVYVDDEWGRARLFRKHEPKGILGALGILRPKAGHKFASEQDMERTIDVLLEAEAYDGFARKGLTTTEDHR